MHYYLRVLIIIFLLADTAIVCLGAAEKLYCSVCSKRIKHRYLQNQQQQIFCSEECLESTLPRCSYCRKICKNQIINALDKLFCSRECAENALLERCDSCHKTFREGRKIPTVNGSFKYCLQCSKRPGCLVCERHELKMKKFANGNYLCRDCNKNVIDSPEKLTKLFRQVRNLM